MAEQESVSQTRSRNMAAIRGKDTAPELAIRRILHSMGMRFRLHRKDLPGSPDIVLPRHRTVVFVHGCFWHRHEGCRYTTTPKTRQEFWLAKFESNVFRDRRNQANLEQLGWRVLVVWECELRKPEALRRRIAEAFQPFG
jgi:DNA mismatch endonuclease (patch repair protein)